MLGTGCLIISLVGCDRQPTSSPPAAIAARDAPQAGSVGGAVPCADLANVRLPGATITTTDRVSAGGFVPPPGALGPTLPLGAPSMYAGLPPFCRVAATIHPVPESEIKFEIWLPERWNGRFVGVGNGGVAGFIFHFAMAEPLSRGYAVASTDTGHAGGMADWSFAVHREKLIDHGYRATHEMTVQSKAIVVEYYGTAARRAYWSGCSAGGRQGLMEASRFPDDYDGIVAGAPANNLILEAFRHVAIRQAATDPAGALTSDKLRFVTEAALAACDARDGVRDRTVTEPLKCQFNPEVLRCKAGDRPDCLTARQVEWVQRIYRGVVSPRTGSEIYPGILPTSEVDWLPPPFAAEMGMIGVSFFRDAVFQNPKWDPFSLDIDADLPRARAQDGGITVMTDPDLGAFGQRGGKLLLWHGWSDGAIAPRNTINFYRSMVETMGEARTRAQARLFMAPGVQHCGGGEGPSNVDFLTAIEEWVENGKAPERVIASRPLEGGAMRTRPLCAYPQLAVYNGAGSTDDAGNFACKAP